MNTFEAVAIVEGDNEEEIGNGEYLQAWQYLIDTGQAWTLQGWYGRTAYALIDSGDCMPASPW